MPLHEVAAERTPGAQSRLEVDAGAGLELRLAPRVSLFATPSVLYSPAPSSILTRSALARADVALGVSLYF